MSSVVLKADEWKWSKITVSTSEHYTRCIWAKKSFPLIKQRTD